MSSQIPPRVSSRTFTTVILNSFQDLFPKFTIPLIIRRCPSAQIKSQTKKSPHALAKKISDFPPSNQFPTHRSRSYFPFQFKKSPVRTAPAQFSSFPLQSLTQPSLHKKKRRKQMHPHSLSTFFTYTPHTKQAQLFILCCSYSSNYCTYSPHHYHAAQLLANLLKLLPEIFPFQGRAFTFPPQLYSLNKKKSGSYRWQLSLPSESAKIASAILPYGSHPHFPTTTLVVK